MPLAGIFGIGGIDTKTGSFDVYNANQYTPSQLAKYIQAQAHNKTAAMCPKAGRLQSVMPVSVNSDKPKNDRPFCRCHLFF